MIYHIEYLHISGPRHIRTDSVWQLSQLLDTVLEDKENSVETIKIWTEEKNK